MTIYTNGTWAGGCIHTIIEDRGIQAGVKETKKWLLSLSENNVLQALISEVDSGLITQKKANSMLEFYSKQTFNAYKEV